MDFLQLVPLPFKISDPQDIQEAVHDKGAVSVLGILKKRFRLVDHEKTIPIDHIRGAVGADQRKVWGITPKIQLVAAADQLLK